MTTPDWPSLSSLVHGVAVAAGLLIYLLVTRIGKQQRRPSVALAWVLVIAAFPYAGIALFLLFGARKFPRPQRQALSHRPGSFNAVAPLWATRLLDVMDIKPLTCNAAVRLHKDGNESWLGLMDVIDSARLELDVCTFLLGGDEVGNTVVNQLIARARLGIKIRLLIDAVGCMRTPRKQINRLRAAGIQVRQFMPILHNPTRGRTNLRIHRKLALGDRQKLWSGGRNLADEYFIDRPGKPAWIDLSFIIEGPLATQAHAQFERDWDFASGRGDISATEKWESVAPAGTIPAQWIPSGPDHADDTIYQLLLTAAYQAESRILAVTPYFVPNDTLLEAWCMASRRGVTITLIVPESSNHVLADFARGRALLTLIEAGVQVLIHPGMVHAKMVVIDNALGLCGSVNLDGRSLFLNYEAMAAFYGADEIAWLTTWHTALSQCSIPYVARHPSWGRDVVEGIVRVVGFEL